MPLVDHMAVLERLVSLMQATQAPDMASSFAGWKMAAGLFHPA